MSTRDHAPGQAQVRDDSYRDAIDRFGPALDRLARAYEADPETRRDLIQDIHFAIWRSFGSYDGRCSPRTWIYRVAHNTATSHITRAFRVRQQRFVTLDELSVEPAVREPSADEALDHRRTLERLYALIRQLDPIDRQVIVSYLEGIEAAGIAEIVGTSPGAIGMKVHRIKRVLALQFNERSRS
ncbi:RNA polymerase sigma factor CnrH [Luteitalea pratensis]|uniref:RNA polymerase sigma factor CnrH n=1 Tax=Luteitalea pratensis TaxID=1855912 RepID=A0A143PG08_LUTPR|nr:sigma-70 family RNA polymerase sigma factor [Luteitalea pratensis]AMY07465.1 RNA polymerase sigma factor CnrH [Luteitalea pratensis]